MYGHSGLVADDLEAKPVTTVEMLTRINRWSVWQQLKDLQVFSRYKVSSRTSESSILVSPPNTIKAFPTNKEA
jgi:hypothetical protein